jgi:hypothetical protein
MKEDKKRRHKWAGRKYFSTCLKCGATRDKRSLTPTYTDRFGNYLIGETPDCI